MPNLTPPGAFLINPFSPKRGKINSNQLRQYCVQFQHHLKVLPLVLFVCEKIKRKKKRAKSYFDTQRKRSSDKRKLHTELK